MSIDHRAEAERRLRMAWEEDRAPENVAHLVAEAQVHATLARDEEQAATAADVRDALTLLRRREYAVRGLVSAHIAKALASRDSERWTAAVDLAKALDEAGASMDDLVDNWLSDDGWDPRSAWKTPAGGGWVSRAANSGSTAPDRDPWTPVPDVTDQIPEVVRRLFADHLAQMLLNGDGEAVQLWARNFAFALKNEGADLTGDIEKRITDLTLGRDPSDPPF